MPSAKGRPFVLRAVDEFQVRGRVRGAASYNHLVWYGSLHRARRNDSRGCEEESGANQNSMGNQGRKNKREPVIVHTSPARAALHVGSCRRDAGAAPLLAAPAAPPARAPRPPCCPVRCQWLKWLGCNTACTPQGDGCIPQVPRRVVAVYCTSPAGWWLCGTR